MAYFTFHHGLLTLANAWRGCWYFSVCVFQDATRQLVWLLVGLPTGAGHPCPALFASARRRGEFQNLLLPASRRADFCFGEKQAQGLHFCLSEQERVACGGYVGKLEFATHRTLCASWVIKLRRGRLSKRFF